MIKLLDVFYVFQLAITTTDLILCHPLYLQTNFHSSTTPTYKTQPPLINGGVGIWESGDIRVLVLGWQEWASLFVCFLIFPTFCTLYNA